MTTMFFGKQSGDSLTQGYIYLVRGIRGDTRDNWIFEGKEFGKKKPNPNPNMNTNMNTNIPRTYT